jgi:pimeloyl-ACP methyl ester carboxylesterase
MSANATQRVVFEVSEGFSLVGTACGDPAGPKVFLMHGGAQSRGAWDRGLRALAAAGYRAIALDMRGHGESDWAPDGRYALEDWAGDLIRIVAKLSEGGERRPVALVGASRGGQCALLGAVALPEMVSCAVLIDVTPQNDESGIDLIRGFLERSAAGFDSLEEASASLSEFMNRPPRGSAEGLARFMRRGDDGRWFWQWDPRMAQREFVRPPSEQMQMEAAAARVKAPVLLVRAGNSELIRPEDVDHFRALTPHLDVVEAPGIGHMITADSNDAFMPPVLEFLRRVHPT